MPTARPSVLTPDLVAHTLRHVPDTGPPAGMMVCNEADWDAAAEAILKARPEGQDFWIFAYGSLLWNPVMEAIEERIATARGWHRAFRMYLRTWRGTVDQPALMMGLDRGGQCKGLACRLPEESVQTQLQRLLRRELPMKPVDTPSTQLPRWVSVETAQGALKAVAFVINPLGANYAGRLAPEETAKIMSYACGHGGSCAEYLYNTITHLELLGIHDRGLRKLQSLVACNIRNSMMAVTMPSPSGSNAGIGGSLGDDGRCGRLSDEPR
jgi:glutathione-specific gamma-glutamylcyclotransferase